MTKVSYNFIDDVAFHLHKIGSACSDFSSVGQLNVLIFFDRSVPKILSEKFDARPRGS